MSMRIAKFNTRELLIYLKYELKVESSALDVFLRTPGQYPPEYSSKAAANVHGLTEAIGLVEKANDILRELQ